MNQLTAPGETCKKCQKGHLLMKKGGRYTGAHDHTVTEMPYFLCDTCQEVGYDKELLALIDKKIREIESNLVPLRFDFVHLGIGVPFPIRH